MSSLLRAKRALESVAGPVTFDLGEYNPSDLSRHGETHRVAATVTVLGERVTGTGCCHLCALDELDEILRVRTRRMIREALEL